MLELAKVFRNCNQIFRGRRRGLFAALLALAAIGLTMAAPPAAAQRGPTLVEVDEVITEPLRQTQPVQGRFVARQAGPVAARTRGAVTAMHVFVGDTVAEGEPLATLDTARLQAETQRRRAEVQYRAAQLEGAEARHAQAEQELARLEGLRRSAAFSRARYDDQVSAVISAKSAIAESEALLQTAKAELALAEIDLKHSVVAAPFDGVVTQRYTQAGAFLNEGDPVIYLVDHQSLEIEADIPASRVAALQEGMTVTAFVEGEATLSAEVRAIVPQENTLARTRAVRFSPLFDPTLVGAAAEAAVTVRVPVGAPRDVVTVHKDAIVQQGGTAVYAVEDGKAIRKPVRLGEPAGNRFVVIDGLAPGALVVVRGNERLQSGQAVRFPGINSPSGPGGGEKQRGGTAAPGDASGATINKAAKAKKDAGS